MTFQAVLSVLFINLMIRFMSKVHVATGFFRFITEHGIVKHVARIFGWGKYYYNSTKLQCNWFIYWSIQY